MLWKVLDNGVKFWSYRSLELCYLTLRHSGATTNMMIVFDFMYMHSSKTTPFYGYKESAFKLYLRKNLTGFCMSSFIVLSSVFRFLFFFFFKVYFSGF